MKEKFSEPPVKRAVRRLILMHRLALFIPVGLLAGAFVVRNAQWFSSIKFSEDTLLRLQIQLFVACALTVISSTWLFWLGIRRTNRQLVTLPDKANAYFRLSLIRLLVWVVASLVAALPVLFMPVHYPHNISGFSLLLLSTALILSKPNLRTITRHLQLSIMVEEPAPATQLSGYASPDQAPAASVASGSQSAAFSGVGK